MKTWWIMAILFLVTNHLQAQDAGLVTPVPPSPEAQSIFKFSTLPVSEYTGLPDITIPLYAIQCKRISVPISLQYHSGGIRITDVSSSVGMGWALNCGGLLNQTVRGLDDLLIDGRTKTPINVLSPDNCDVLAAAQGRSDPEPDMFSYSILGNSGNFILDSNSVPVQLEEKKVRIEDSLDLGLTWKITDTKGVQYFFQSFEHTTSQTGVSESHGAPFISDKSSRQDSKTWYLNRIVDIPGDTVFFNYDSTIITDYLYANETQNFSTSPPGVVGGFGTPSPPSIDYGINAYYIKQITVRRRLKSVVFPGGYLSFIQGGTRCDLSGDTYLGKIILYNSGNTQLKEFDLDYKYLIGNQLQDLSTVDCSSDVPGINYSGNTQPNNFVTRRLMLTGVDFSDADSNKIYSYSLDYESSLGLPDRFSPQQDLWGYYNGNGYTNLLQGAQRTGDSVLGIPIYSYPIAGKNPSLTYAKQGILKKITYPTGGYSAFTYELNAQPYALPNSTTHTYPLYTVSGGSAGSGQHLTDFTVNDISGSAKISIELNICTYAADRTRGSFNIINSDNEAVVVSQTTVNSTIPTGGTMTVTLPNGNYTLEGSIDNFPCSYTIQIDPWTDIQSGYTMINKDYGGLRIKNIANYDPVTGNLLVNKYQYTFPNGISSMVLYSLPIDYGSYQIRYIGPSAEFTNNFVVYAYLQINSSTHYPLASAQNGLFGYSHVKVTEFDSINNIDNGYSIHQADTSVKNLPYQLVHPYTGSGFFGAGGLPDKFPWAPSADFSWARGKPKIEEQFRRDSGENYTCIHRKKYFYSPVKYTNSVFGYSVGFRNEVGEPNPNNPACPVTGLIFADYDLILTTPYELFAGYRTMDSTVEENIVDSSSELKILTYYQYDTSNLQPSLVKKVNSKDELSYTGFRYPKDYSINGTPGSPSAQGIQNLQHSNDIDEIVESYNQKSNIDGSNLRTTAAILLTFKPSLIVRDSIFTTENTGGFTGFSPTAIDSSGIIKDSHYQPKIKFDSYDANGNILQEHKISDNNLSYIWDYQNVYPIAHAINAVQTDIAYTSFEADGTGDWSIGSGTIDSTMAVTGKNSWHSHSNISKAGLNSGTTYVVSYWTDSSTAYTISGTISGYPQKGKTINGWTLYVHRVTGQTTITINVTGRIDELRLYPLGSQMTTYTYSPLVGITSHTDVANRVTYYEYDGLQRLKRIRDQDHNILKTLDYQYQFTNNCGPDCFIEPMQTLAGTNTLGYPVGVFNVHGNLLGNASSQSAYITLWNADTADSHTGTLAGGADSLHFQITLNTGKTLPVITGCRYYQVDVHWNKIDGIRNLNGTYVDFGDGTGMHLGKTLSDTPAVIASNTTYATVFGQDRGAYEIYFVHTYSTSFDTSRKTLTLYHNDANESEDFDNLGSSPGLKTLTNLRGNLPQNTDYIGGSSYQQPGMTSIDSIYNWSSIHNIHGFRLNDGDGVDPCEHIHYPQDFLAANQQLDTIFTAPSYYTNGVRDTSFKISRLKSNWNTYFTHLRYLDISDRDWNREDLSALKELTVVQVTASTSDDLDDTGSSLVTIPSSEVDAILNQAAAGAGQQVHNGFIFIDAGGPLRTSASDAAVRLLKEKGWQIQVNRVTQ